MSRYAILIPCALSATMDVQGARAEGPVPATAKLGLGICALDSLRFGVQARGCAGAAAWTIPAPPVAKAAIKGGAGGFLGAAVVDVLVNDGDSLWMGVSERREGALQPRGLVRQEWRKGAAHVFRGTDAGPCGFHVQDLLLRDDTLWVATDLGVSRLRLSREDWDEWTHYALASDRVQLEETACASMLAGVSEAAAAPGGEELGRWLAEFRPGFVKRLRRGTRPASARNRRRNEQTLGDARRARAGRGADVHPRPRGRPQAAQDGGRHGGVAAQEDVGVGHRKGVP